MLGELLELPDSIEPQSFAETVVLEHRCFVEITYTQFLAASRIGVFVASVMVSENCAPRKKILVKCIFFYYTTLSKMVVEASAITCSPATDTREWGSCAIVGHSSGLYEQNYGVHIDQLDTVFALVGHL